MKLMYAAVIRAADRRRGLTVGEFEQRQLKAIREELNRAHAERTRPGRAPDPECVPIEIIQQESDLTRDAGPGYSREVYRPE